MKNAFGIEVGGSTQNTNWLQEGEVVKIMLLERVPIQRYKKDLDERNAKNKEKADSLGIDFKEEPYSWKENGIAWDFAVIFRSKDGMTPDIPVLNIDDPMCDPQMKFTGRIEMPSLPKLLQHPNSTVVKGGVDKIRKDNYPLIEYLLPAVFPAKDWTTGVTADNIPPEDIHKYADLIDKEQKRKEEWDNYLHMYKNLSEEEALAVLERHLSQVYLLCGYEEDQPGLKYYKPQKGMVFNAKLGIENGKFLKPIVYELRNKQYNFWWKPVKAVSESMELYADQVIDIRNRIYDEFAKKKAEESKQEENIPEQPGF
jgi:hypothetical protein